MKKSITLSIILHIVLLGTLLYTSSKNTPNELNGDGTGNKAGPGKEIGNIADKPIEVMKLPPQMQSKLKKRVKLPNKKRPKQNKECEHFYGGIGIILNPDGSILSAYPGYPAYNAGIRGGDVIVESSEEIKGPIGTPVTMIIQSGQDRYQVTVIREKICLTNQP